MPDSAAARQMARAVNISITSHSVSRILDTRAHGKHRKDPAMANLPLIDVAPLLDATSFHGPSGQAQIDALHAACTGPGFFYLTHHGVPAADEHALFALARRFFALP